MAIASGKWWLNVLSAYDSSEHKRIEKDPQQLVLSSN